METVREAVVELGCGDYGSTRSVEFGEYEVSNREYYWTFNNNSSQSNPS